MSCGTTHRRIGGNGRESLRSKVKTLRSKFKLDFTETILSTIKEKKTDFLRFVSIQIFSF